MPQPLLQQMVAVLDLLQKEVNSESTLCSAGRPWDLNLRDLMRWCNLIEDSIKSGSRSTEEAVCHFLPMLIIQRFRSVNDRMKVQKILANSDFNTSAIGGPCSAKTVTYISSEKVMVGWAELTRNGECMGDQPSKITDCLLNSQLDVMESIAHSVEKCWPVLLTGPHGSGKFHQLVSITPASDVITIQILSQAQALHASWADVHESCWNRSWKSLFWSKS